MFNQKFPECDESALKKDTIEMVLQINGKVRAKFEINSDASKEEIEKLVNADESLNKHFSGKTVRKIIVIPGKIVNVVAN